MKIHFCNCASFCPLNQKRLINLVTQCLVMETKSGLVVADTGIGRGYIENRETKLGFRIRDFVLGVQNDLSEALVVQLEKKGINPNEVKHIFLSHLDFDHCSGLKDFPKAKIHLSETEWKTANKGEKLKHRLRYRRNFWDHNPEKELYSDFEPWMDGLARRKMKGIDDHLYLVSLPGHTLGHLGLYIESENILFAGDAFMSHKQIEQDFEPFYLRAYNATSTEDRALYIQTIKQLQRLHKEGIKVINSHDPHLFLKDRI